MRRGSLCFIGVVCALIMIAGCSASEKPNPKGGVGVLFDNVPLLFDAGVYHLGSQVGEIVTTTNGVAGVTKLVVTLQPEFAAREGGNLAFYAHAGRLEAVTLANMGRPLENGAVLSGFTSKAGLYWFRLKTLLSDRVSSASRRAEQLNQRLG